MKSCVQIISIKNIWSYNWLQIVIIICYFKSYDCLKKKDWFRHKITLQTNQSIVQHIRYIISQDSLTFPKIQLKKFFSWLGQELFCITCCTYIYIFVWTKLFIENIYTILWFKVDAPVGWGCKIYQLHLCGKVRLRQWVSWILH